MARTEYLGIRVTQDLLDRLDALTDGAVHGLQLSRSEVARHALEHGITYLEQLSQTAAPPAVAPAKKGRRR